MRDPSRAEWTGAEIAVVGMAGRLPRAGDLDAFWRRLRDGEECVRRFTPQELRAEGVPEALLSDPRFVPARAVLDEPELFDAAFFGMTPREAQVTDPQHRHFLECAWHALEDAGYAAPAYAGTVGVFASCSLNTWWFRLAHHEELVERLGRYRVILGNDKDFLPTWASYRLNLTGPSLAVQTACSSSLVAVHLACQSLLGGECDVALAGGASVGAARAAGYLYQEGGISSPDGHCRAFDAAAQGTVSGDGVGVVVLRRLSDALADGDRVRAVLLGTAINNDGANKVGFTAPSVEGQSRAIGEALAVAGVEPSSLDYVEAHGTGTQLGDPVEIEALNRAFRAQGGTAPGSCLLGSVKTNIGHLDAAAGVAGLMKVVLSLEQGQLPPSLHFTEPNPLIDFASGPFRVNAELSDWPAGETPRRAAVSSFGLGGTNAHTVIEEAPAREASGPSRPWQLLVLSARTAEALESQGRRLEEHLEAHPEQDLADIAWTLMVGRWPFLHRRVVVVADGTPGAPGRAAAALAAGRGRTAVATEARRPVAFLFPGQGSQHPGMGEELYRHEDVFRRSIDRAAEVLRPLLGEDLGQLLYPADGADREAAAAALRRTAVAQPALFAVEHALAELWRHWGIEPAAALGHSVGEWVAAALAGVFPFEDALELVAERGRLMQEMPAGAMLAVPLGEAEVEAHLEDAGGVELAVVNGRRRSVVSGPREAVDAFARRLAEEGIGSRPLHTSHAFHSAAMEPAVAPFVAQVARRSPAEPRLPFVSNVTGTWIRPEEATDPGYWGRQVRRPVRFADGVDALAAEGLEVFLECGPGRALSTLARGHTPSLATVPTLPAAGAAAAAGDSPALASALEALGQLWLHGAVADWRPLVQDQRRHRVALPTYPFERKPHWIEPRAQGPEEESAVAPTVTSPEATEEIAPMPEAADTTLAPGDRYHAAALDALRDLIHDLVGVDASGVDPNASFFELGVDSLLLIQAGQMIQQRFGVNLSLIQLVEELSTLDRLAAHLVAEMTPEALDGLAPEPQAPAPEPSAPATTTGAAPAAPAPGSAAPAAPAPAAPAVPASAPAAPAAPAVPSVTPAAGGELAQLVAQQMQAMNQLFSQQLQALSGAGAAPAQAAVTADPTPAAPAPAPAANASVTEAPAAAPTPVRRRPDYDPVEPVQVAMDGLDERQQRHLEDFIGRYTARTRRSRELAAEHRRSLADNRWTKDFRLAWKEMIYPIQGNRSSGSRLWDVDGNEYVDVSMGFGLHLFGHSPDFLVRALREQLGTSLAVGPQSPVAGEAANLLAELSGLDRAIFVNSGTEAVMASLRAARTWSGKDRIARFSGAYHGWADSTLVRGLEVGGERRTLPGAPGVPAAAVKDTVVLDWASPEGLEGLRQEIGDLGAVIVEPVQSRRPDVQPREFLQEVRRITREAAVPLILDEMVTGFRIHPRGAQAWFDVDADLAIYGKVLAGGLPLGVVAGKAEFMDVLDGGSWSFGDGSYPEARKTLVVGAYFKNPLTIAAVRATLRELKARGPAMQEELNARTGRLIDRLNALFREERAPLEAINCGSLFRIETTENHEANQLFYFHLVQEGVFYTRETGNCFLSTAHTDRDVDLVVEAVERSVAAMQEGGFFPPGSGGRSPRREAGSTSGTTAAATAAATAPAKPSPVFVTSAAAEGSAAAPTRELDFGLYFFGTYDREYSADKYELLFDTARFGDREGFSTLWLPERHFNPVGGLSPNPSVLAAALARETERLQVNAGSVVLPLHSPLRVAEEWALVDNLSGGRSGVAFASGWHPNDFVFAPEAFDDRRDRMYQGIELVRQLWRGEEVTLTNGTGQDHTVRLYPAPSRELPIWLTAASPATYEAAGRLGAGVLTNLFDQTVDDLAAKLELYRRTLEDHGHPPETARVTVLLHSYLAPDAEEAVAVARDPFCGYLRSSLGLLGNLLKAQGREVDLDRLPPEDVDYLLSSAYDRWVNDSALIGSPEGCAPLLTRLAAAGVTEVGCFVDFGVDAERVRDGLQHLLSLRSLHRRQAAAQVDEAQASPASAAAVRGPRRIPANEAQRNLWVLAQLGAGGAAAANEPLEMRLGGDLHPGALAAALQRLVERHEALRLRYADEGTELVVEPAARFPLPRVDLSALAGEAISAEADRLSREAAQRPLETSRAPVAATFLVREAPRRHRWVLVLHHAIIDGHSWTVLLRELRQLYSAYKQGEALQLPPPRRFDDLVARTAEQRDPAAADEAADYWRRELAEGFPVLDLPTDHPRPPVQTFHADRVTASYGPEVLAALQSFASGTGSTMFMSVLTGLALLLHRLSGQDDVLVGVNALEPDPDTSPLIGFHTHPVLIRSRLEDGATLRDQVTTLRRRVVAAYQHQDVSLPHILRELGVRRDPSRPPLSAVVFNMDRAKPTLDFDDLDARTATLPSGARVELTINVSEREDELFVACDYNRDLYRGTTVERWLAELRGLLLALGEDTEAPLARLLEAAPAGTVEGGAVEGDDMESDEEADLPLTRYQQLMWMAQQLEPDSPQLGAPFLHAIPSDLDAGRFRRSWEALVAASDALRTVFVEVDGAPVQRVLEKVEGGHEELDLSTTDDPKAELELWARERGAAPLPITERCFDSVLVRLGPEEHVWYLNTHHLVADAWALGLAFRHLGDYYALAGEGRLDEAPAPPPFRDFVRAEGRYLASAEARRAERWWRQRLEDAPEAPAFFGRTAPRTSTRVERVSLSLGAERSRRLAEIAAAEPYRVRSSRASAANLFTTFVAALVHRLSGARRVALGTPYHNRPDARRKDTIGTLMQIVPLHLEVRPDDTLADLAGRVATAGDVVHPYREYPVGNPVERPAYHVECNFIVADLASFDGVPAEVTWIHPGQGRESLAVHARDFAGSGELEVDFDFHADVFDADQRRLTLDAFLHLVDRWLESPGQPLATVDLLGDEERRELLEERNRTDHELPPGTFLDRFAERVEQFPERVAVRATGAALSYADLDRRSAALARRLAAAGVGPETVVAVLAPRGLQFLTALLAVLRAGGSYLPLDPASPPARLSRVLEDAAAAAVLVAGTPALSAARVAVGQTPQPARVMEITPEVEAGLAGEEPLRDPVPPLPEQRAYVLYTSGSTGAPKGAMVTHLGMLNHLQAKVLDLEMGAEDVVVQNASQSFDISVWQFLGPLMVGGTVVVASDDEARDPGRLLALARRHGVTVLEMVPALLRELTAAVAAEGAGVRPERLRWMMSTGEALPVDLWRDWLRAVPEVPLVNAYGPTECSDDVTHALLREEPAPERRISPVGLPIVNTRLYVLDAGLRPVPRGLPGELYAAGTGVGRGYLGDPARTAAAFLPDPFAAEEGLRMYRTGDFARWLEDGDLEVLGRVDHQVKVRGHRIEPGEVESALREHPAVSDAVVMARTLGSESAARSLVAWIVVPADEAPGVADLRSFLAQRLPDFMVPAAFVRLEALPLNSSGKVDRRALPEPSAEDLSGDADYEAPRSETERKLAAIWADVLGRERVGIHDDFFEIGGDSILALQIVSRASRAGVRLSAAQLFQEPTVARLAAAGAPTAAALADQGPVEGDVPLTPVQRWFFDLDPADPNHFNQAVLLALREALEPRLVRAALADLVVHHDALRARFRRQDDGTWSQLFLEPGAVPAPYTLVDLDALPAERRIPALESFSQAVQESLDLAEGPVLRAVHLRLGDPGERLLMVAHHLVMDGVSWRVLLEDLESSYRALETGVRPELPPKTTSFRTWAERLLEEADGGAVQTEGLQWLSRPWRQVVPLPEELEGPDTAASTEVVSVSLGPDETRTLLQEVPGRLGATMDAVLLGGLAHVLHGWSGGRFGLVELESHGRHALGGRVDLSRTVGWFTSMYPVILEADPKGGAAAAVARVARHLEDVPEQGLSFGLLRHLGKSPTAQRVRDLPRPQVGFNYLGRLDNVFQGSELFLPANEETGRTSSRRSPRSHLLDVAAMAVDGRFQVHWSFSRNRYRRETVERLAEGFLESLRQLLAPSRQAERPAAEAPGAATGEAARPAAAPGGLEDFGWDADDLAELKDAMTSNKQENFHAGD